jgi:hypothetical protein
MGEWERAYSVIERRCCWEFIENGEESWDAVEREWETKKWYEK